MGDKRINDEDIYGDERRVTALHLSRINEDAVALGQVEGQLWASVESARRAGVSWEMIGRALGCSRQAAQQRFSKPARGRLV